MVRPKEERSHDSQESHDESTTRGRRILCGTERYVCLRVADGARRGVAAAAVPALAERLGLRERIRGRGRSPAEAIAYLRRVGATPAAIEDDGLLRADAVVHVASASARRRWPSSAPR